MAVKEWYSLSVQEVAKSLKTDISRGLSEQEAAGRLSKYGANSVKQKESESPFVLFIKQFQDFMVIVLLAATAVSGFLGEIDDAVTILAIVILNAVLGFIQEYRAEQSLAALKRLAAPMGKVVRGGRMLQVESAQLVPGDLILLESGDRVPADARLIETASLEAEEAALTGESVPTRKQTDAIPGDQVPLGDRRNMVYASTVLTQGRGRAIVTDTGMATELGKIAKMIHEAEDEETPLQKRLDHLGKWLVGLCLALCSMVVVAGVLRGEPWDKMFLTGVSLAVAAIPEGLPAIVTIALAIGVQRMIKRNAIVRKLPAVETLGCTTVICSDKTGTLTQNAMTVTRMWLGAEPIEVTGKGYDPLGEIRMGGRAVHPADMPELNKALEICALCNNSQITRTSDKGVFEKLKKAVGAGSEPKWKAEGDPTEGALMALAMKGGLSPAGTLSRHRRISEIPFDSDRKMMSVVYEDQRGKRYLYVKGAPDVIISKCEYQLKGKEIEGFSQGARDMALVHNDRFAGQALRVLGLAYRELSGSGQTPTPENLEKNLVFVGLVGMIDPPREEAKNAIKVARTAGIKTVMITGDHKATAVAIARELGLADAGSRAVSGDELERMSDRELDKAVAQISVYARVSPKHKLRIVKAWKRKGQIVAMTGDGVNDAPAVKEADIGISMGVSGTDVTKEASSMILADDNFATIVAAVEEGRSIYANIRKFIRYLLACNIGEVLTMFLATVCGLPMLLLPMQILWTNLVTDGLPALALGVDTTEKGIMEQNPRDPSENIFSGGLRKKIIVQGVSIALCTLAAFIYGMMTDGGSLEKGQTIAFTTLVMSQLFFVFNCRSERRTIFELGFFTNMYLVAAVAVSVAMQLAVIYIPFLQTVFKTTPISGFDWIIVAALSGWSLLMTGAARLGHRVVFRRIAVVRA